RGPPRRPALGRSRRTDRRCRSAGREASLAAFRAWPIAEPGRSSGRCGPRLQTRFRPAPSWAGRRDEPSARAGSFMEWPAPPSGVVGSPANQEEGGMDISVLGIDLGKNVCSVVGLDASGAVVMRRRMRRETLIGLAERLPACIVGMEACCGSHHLGRVFASHSHDVRLMSPEYVRPYVKAQKNDDRDAEGIAEAATRPTMRFVELKSPDQLDMQTLHRR